MKSLADPRISAASGIAEETDEGGVVPRGGSGGGLKTLLLAVPREY